MDFKLTSDQQELQKVAREFAVNELTSLANEMEESASPVPKDVLKKLENWDFSVSTRQQNMVVKDYQTLMQ